MPRRVQDLKPTFAAGVLSPDLHGRVDLEKFQAGLSRCDNFVVLPHGGIQNRGGLECIGEAPDSSRRIRAKRFAFNTLQQYTLIFGHLTMRVVKDGEDVVEADVPVTALDLASVNPVLRCPAHSFSAGDDVYVDGITNAPPGAYRIKATTTDTIELWGFDGEDIPTGPQWVYTANAKVNRIYTLTTPYDGADLMALKFTQSADTMIITHPSYTNRALTRTDHAAWTLTAITYGASVATPTGQSATPTGAGAVPHSYKITAFAAGAESVASATATANNAATLGTSNYNTVAWSAVAGAEYYAVYKLRGGVYGFLGIATGLSLVDDGSVIPDMTDTPPTAKTIFDAAGKYPSCATFHKQRLVYGRTDQKPSGIFGSRVADYYNHNTSVPAQEDDALEFEIAAEEANEIRHLVSLDNALLAFTSGAEWAIRGAGDGLITPASIDPRRQGQRGCNDVPPLLVGDTVLFIEPSGAVVRDFNYSVQTDKYGGSNLSVLAEHLFAGYEIVDWAYQQYPYSIVWAVRSDGVVLALTYMREHDVWAWHTHTTTNGAVESVAVVRENLIDVVYFTVRRVINGRTKRFYERMDERRFSRIEDAFFVDCGIRYEGDPRDEFTGLEFLEGETLAVLADGNVHPPVTVTDGRVVLQRNYSTVVLGLPMVADAETLPLDPRASVLNMKQIAKAKARVRETRGLALGPSAAALYEPPPVVVAYDTPIDPYTGLVEFDIDGGWSDEARLYARQAYPLPATITSLIPDVTVSSR